MRKIRSLPRRKTALKMPVSGSRTTPDAPCRGAIVWSVSSDSSGKSGSFSGARSPRTAYLILIPFEDGAGVLPAEAEPVGERDIDRHLAGDIRHIVEIAFRIGIG